MPNLQIYRSKYESNDMNLLFIDNLIWIDILSEIINMIAIVLLIEKS